MAVRLTFEQRVEILKGISPELELIDEFIGKNGKYWCTYKCSCSNITTKSWNDLQSGKKQCSKCSNSRTLTFEERVELLKERQPYVILLTATRIETDRFLCEFKTTFSDEVRTKEWTNLISKHKPINPPSVSQQKKDKKFQEYKDKLKVLQPDYELIKPVYYKNGQVKYEYKCPCGNISVSQMKDLYEGKKCNNCKENNLLTIEEKQEIINELQPGVKILSNRISEKGKSICKFTCKNCGEVDEKLWDNIKLSPFCKECNPKKKYTFEDRIKIMKEVNPDIKLLSQFKKNGDFWIKYNCSCGNENQEKIWEHLREGAKCMSCSGLRFMDFNERVEKLKEVNPTITLLDHYIDDKGNTKCKYICGCGEENVADYQHLRIGGSCFKCGVKKTSEYFKFTLDEIKSKLFEINTDIEIIDDTYVNSKTKIKCRCKLDGHIFKIDWESLRTGSGCPKCNTTRGERKITLYLDNNKVEYVHFKQFDDLYGISGYRKLVYDFYLPNHNTLIEFDGVFHFQPIILSKNKTQEKIDKSEKDFEKRKYHDKLKDDYAIKNNIKIIRIDYLNYNNIDEILKKELNSDEIPNKEVKYYYGEH